jgi:hypothetical protein
VEGTPTQPLMTFPLTCILGDTLFTHSFLVLPNCHTLLLGRDILSKFQATLTLSLRGRSHFLLNCDPLTPYLHPHSSSLPSWMPCFLLPQAPPNPLSTHYTGGPRCVGPPKPCSCYPS